MFNMFNVIDKESEITFSNGALYSILAIVMVFAVLLIIIGITTLIFKMNGLFEMKAELDKAKNQSGDNSISEVKNDKKDIPASTHIEIKDDDMLAAVLTATIDYQNEVKKDIKVLYVKEL